MIDALLIVAVRFDSDNGSPEGTLLARFCRDFPVSPFVGMSVFAEGDGATFDVKSVTVNLSDMTVFVGLKGIDCVSDVEHNQKVSQMVSNGWTRKESF